MKISAVKWWRTMAEWHGGFFYDRGRQNGVFIWWVSGLPPLTTSMKMCVIEWVHLLKNKEYLGDKYWEEMLKSYWYIVTIWKVIRKLPNIKHGMLNVSKRGQNNLYFLHDLIHWTAIKCYRKNKHHWSV